SIDTATGMVTTGAAPPVEGDCPPPPDLSVSELTRRPFEGQVPGFAADTVLTEGGVSVAVGRRGAGVRVPMAIGLAADGRSPSWQVTLPTVDEASFVEDSSHPVQFALRGGRVFGVYSVQANGPFAAGGRLVALDARTGARLWESEIPSCCAHGTEVDAIRVGPNRVLLEQFGEADVYDAAGGQRLARISPW